MYWIFHSLETFLMSDESVIQITEERVACLLIAGSPNMHLAWHVIFWLLKTLLQNINWRIRSAFPCVEFGLNFLPFCCLPLFKSCSYKVGSKSLVVRKKPHYPMLMFLSIRLELPCVSLAIWIRLLTHAAISSASVLMAGPVRFWLLGAAANSPGCLRSLDRCE